MRIVAIADTHVPGRGRVLPQVLIDALREADLILHAGDITSRPFYDELRAIGRLEAVYGNADPLDLRIELPKRLVVEAESARIGLAHGDGLYGTALQRARRGFESGPSVNAIVFGHQHYPYCEYHNGVLCFSPGSPTDPRRAPRPSFGVLHVKGDQIRGEIVWL